MRGIHWPNKVTGANSRPASPLDAGQEFVSASCAPSSWSAAVAQFCSFAMNAKRPAAFLNVDLEIVSRSKLDAIESSISGLAHALYHGPAEKKGHYLLSLECNKHPKDANTGILALCTAIERLGKAEQRLWDNALSRTFDVGYQLQSGVDLVQSTLRSETLARVVALGGAVAFSCYRNLDSEQDAAGNSRPAGQSSGS
jgi:hypothetical protein